jgi:hypothetical protein
MSKIELIRNQIHHLQNELIDACKKLLVTCEHCKKEPK